MVTGLRQMVADLRVHPGRNVLTAISLFLGVFAVMAIIVTGDTVKEVFVATAEQQGGRSATFARTVSLPPTTGQADLVDMMAHLPVVPGVHLGCSAAPAESVFPLMSPVSSAAAQQETTGITVTFVCGDYGSVYRLPMSQGRWLSDASAVAPYEVVMNKNAASTLGGVGTQVWLAGETTNTSFPVDVVGVVNDGAPQPTLYTSARAWFANAPQLVAPSTLTLLWQEPGAAQTQVESVTNDWLTDRGLSRDSAVTQTDTLAGFQGFIAVMQWSFAGVAGLSLAVAALGIVNVGLASVRERAHELVIRRAIGASKASIVQMIVGSSLLLAVFVAAVSAVVAWVGLLVFRGQIAYDSPIVAPGYPVTAAVVGVSVSVVTALVGSIIPGIVASRLQPGLALRD